MSNSSCPCEPKDCSMLGFPVPPPSPGVCPSSCPLNPWHCPPTPITHSSHFLSLLPLGKPLSPLTCYLLIFDWLLSVWPVSPLRAAALWWPRLQLVHCWTPWHIRGAQGISVEWISGLMNHSYLSYKWRMLSSVFPEVLQGWILWRKWGFNNQKKKRGFPGWNVCLCVQYLGSDSPVQEKQLYFLSSRNLWSVKNSDLGNAW